MSPISSTTWLPPTSRKVGTVQVLKVVMRLGETPRPEGGRRPEGRWTEPNSLRMAPPGDGA